MSKKRIAISGTIGAGKSTLVDSLGELENFRAHPEEVDLELLDLFTKVNIEKSIKSDKPVELINQFNFLSSTIKRDAKVMFDKNVNHIMDRSIVEHVWVFAKQNLKPSDWALYFGLQELILNQLKWDKYDLTILLRNDLNVNLQKIEKRGREEEKLTSEYVEYLKELNNIYNSQEFYDILKEYSENVVIIDVTDKTADEVYEEALEVINSVH